MLRSERKFLNRLEALSNLRGLYCAPDAPDVSSQAAASEKVGMEQVALGREQLDWAKTLGEEQLGLAREVLGAQTDIMRENQTLAVEDRNRYRSNFGALEDQVAQEAKDYASPDRVEREVGKATADVISAYDKVKASTLRQQTSFGIDPTSGAAMGNLRIMDINQAKDLAGAATKARSQVEDMGWAKKLDAVSIGKGLPAQASTSYGIAVNAGNSAVGNLNNTAGAVGNNMGAAQNWYQGGAQAIGQSANILNANYQNEVAASNANMGFLGGALGTGAKLWLGSSKDFKTDKERVPEDAILDRVENLPVEKWRYKPGIEDGGAAPHIGPYAEDFQMAFGTGGDGKSINVADAIGVNLAATKALAKKVEQLEKTIGYGVGD